MPTIQRWKCVCAYDGRGFSGWQSQPRGDAVQDVIEARLRQILGQDVRVHGSGRTDAGVHAIAQVFHFDAAWRHAPDQLLAALRSGLPETLQIKTARRASPNFHARFSASGKLYEYRIHLGDPDPFIRPYVWAVFRPVDVTAMRAAAAELEGRHDFRAFTALNGVPREDTIRELRALRVRRRGAIVRIEAEADGFLYKMVRSLVGVLVGIGEGRVDRSVIQTLLNSGRRTPVVQTAPAQGLFLRRVAYGRVRARPSAEPVAGVLAE